MLQVTVIDDIYTPLTLDVKISAEDFVEFLSRDAENITLFNERDNTYYSIPLNKYIIT